MADFDLKRVLGSTSILLERSTSSASSVYWKFLEASETMASGLPAICVAMYISVWALNNSRVQPADGMVAARGGARHGHG